MYGKEINYQNLIQSLSIADQLDVFSWTLGKYVSLNQFITNPMRIDSNPQCKLREYRGIVFLTDYAYPEYNKYTCIHSTASMLSNIYHRPVVLHEAAQFIAIHRHYGTKPILTTTQVITGKTLKGRPSKSDIYFIPFSNADGQACFIDRDKQYWSKRFVTSSQLCNDSRGGRVYSVKRFYVNNRAFYPKGECFGYTVMDKVKIYQPYETDDKWYGTTTKNSYWLTKRGSDKLLIAKANKDHLVAENIFLDWDIYSGMNESIFPTTFSDIIANYPIVWSLLDNDMVGLKASKYLRETFGVTTKIINPETGCKDLDEFVITQDILPKLEDLPLIDLM